MLTSSFGQLLLQLRQRSRRPQKEIAAAAGLDASYLASLERGRRTAPRTEIIERLLRALNASLDERKCLLAAAATDRLVHTIARHEAQISGASAIARIASRLPQLLDEDLVTLEQVALGFASRAGGIPVDSRTTPLKKDPEAERGKS